MYRGISTLGNSFVNDSKIKRIRTPSSGIRCFFEKEPLSSLVLVYPSTVFDNDLSIYSALSPGYSVKQIKQDTRGHCVILLY